MFDAGLIAETRGLLERYGDLGPDSHSDSDSAAGGLDARRNNAVCSEEIPDTPRSCASPSEVRPMVLNSLGYRQAAQFLAGELTLDEAIAAAQQGHRNYAKRQMTWFRREPDVCWLEGFGDDPLIQQQSLERVAEFVHD
jgi:tRNA dimethylallyltransferase